MGPYYLRPDVVYRTGNVRPAYNGQDLQQEIADIARAFSSGSQVAAVQYGRPANVPVAEPVPVPQPTTSVSVRPGLIARFFGRR